MRFKDLSWGGWEGVEIMSMSLNKLSPVNLSSQMERFRTPLDLFLKCRLGKAQSELHEMGGKTRQVVHGRIISVAPGQPNTVLNAKRSDQIDGAATLISSAAAFSAFHSGLKEAVIMSSTNCG